MPYYDRFDIAEAHYQFACDYHGGKRSALYAKLCRIGRYLKLSPCWRGFDSLSENGKEIYNALETKNGFPVTVCDYV